MKKRLFLFPLLASFAVGCAKGSYNTSVKLPAGGVPVTEEGKSAEVLTHFSNTLLRLLPSGTTVEKPPVDALIMNVEGITIDAVYEKGTIDAHMSTKEGPVSAKVDLTGNFSFESRYNTAEPDKENFFVKSSFALKLEDLSVKLDLSFPDFSDDIEDGFQAKAASTIQKINFAVFDLDIGIYYLYEGIQNKGYFLVDLSSPSITNLVKSVVDVLVANGFVTKEEKAGTISAINQIISANPKVTFALDDIATLLNAYKDGLDPEEDEDAITELTRIIGLLGIDLVDYARSSYPTFLGMLLHQLPLPSDVDISTMISKLPFVLPSFTTEFVQYNINSTTNESYGFAFNINNKKIKDLGFDLKEKASITVDAGLALVISNNVGLGTDNFLPSYVDLKASVTADGIKTNAGLTLETLYNDRVTFSGLTKTFVDTFTGNGMDLINQIIALFNPNTLEA